MSVGFRNRSADIRVRALVRVLHSDAILQNRFGFGDIVFQFQL